MASTYNKKIKKYKARIRAALAVGAHPRTSDVRKLEYFVARADKKGRHHKVKFKDKRRLALRKVTKSAPRALAHLGKALAVLVAYQRYKQLA